MTDTELRRAFIAGVEFGQQDLSPSLHLHMPTIEAEAASRYPVPDTGDTAALDERYDSESNELAILANGYAAADYRGGAEGRQAAFDALRRYVAALVQAEREACLKIVEQDYSFTVNEQNTRNRIARAIRARSTPTPPTDV